MDRNDKLIALINELRENDMRYAQGQPFTIEYLKRDFDLGFDAGTTKELLPEAAKAVGLEISLSGEDSAILAPPKITGRRRRSILGR
jgi:hypothetical protein